MGKRVGIKQATQETELSEYFLRKGIREGRIPHIRTGLGKTGKIILDLDLLEEYMRQEAVDSVIDQWSGSKPEILHYGQLRQVKL